ncbi:MAG: Rrf2 family transcriptional regulator [Candidatus Geothermincolales bacterium]
MIIKLGFSDAFVLAVHSLALMAGTGVSLKARDIAKTLGASEAHLHKVLALLRKEGILRSSRGPGGGYVLARKPEEITLFEIYASIEGLPGRDPCLLGRENCVGKSCLFSSILGETSERLEEFMRSTSLTQAAGCFAGKSKVPGNRQGEREDATAKPRSPEARKAR